MGRRRGDGDGELLTERLGGIVVTRTEREAIRRKVADLNRESMASLGLRTSEAAYMRRVLVADLKASGHLPPDHM